MLNRYQMNLEKIWDTANRKALESLVFKANEFPLEEKTLDSEVGKKYIDDKRGEYICVMVSLKELGK